MRFSPPTGWSPTSRCSHCRHGLLLNPGAEERFVPFAEIEDAGYYNRAMVERAKAAHVSGADAPLTVRLSSGEAIELPLERRGESIPDLLTIARLIHQRVVIERAERGERWIGKGGSPILSPAPDEHRLLTALCSFLRARARASFGDSIVRSSCRPSRSGCARHAIDVPGPAASRRPTRPRRSSHGWRSRWRRSPTEAGRSGSERPPASRA